MIPVILRPVPWSQAGLDFLQALPEGLRPVVLWSPQDLAYVNICEGLFAAVLVWQGRKSPPAIPMVRSTAVRRRVVDLALSRRAPVRKATMLAVMVRRVGEVDYARYCRQTTVSASLQKRWNLRIRFLWNSLAKKMDIWRRWTSPLRWTRGTFRAARLRKFFRFRRAATPPFACFCWKPTTLVRWC